MSNGFETCDKHTYLFATEAKDCPYCRIDELEQDRDGWIRNYELQEKVVEIAQQRVAELEQELADERHDCADLALQVAKLEQQLSRYQGGVEAVGVISEFGDVLLTAPSPIDIGQKVRVLVKEVE